MLITYIAIAFALFVGAFCAATSAVCLNDGRIGEFFLNAFTSLLIFGTVVLNLWVLLGGLK